MQVETIKKSAEFKLIQETGVKIHGSCFILLARPAEFLRVGFTVSRKVGNSVTRSYVKRKLKHAVFAANFPLASYVVIGKKSAIDVNYEALVSDLSKAANQLIQKNAKNNS